KKGIVGTSIKQIKRRAKLLQIFLSNDMVLVFHLKLTGRILVRKKGTPKDDWQHVTIRLKVENGKLKDKNLELRFCDSRKFGWVKLITKKELGIMNKELGPESLDLARGKPSDILTLKKFQEIVKSTRRPVKVLLMDQKKIAGIGNIYACDALNLAKIHPARKSKKLRTEEIKKLFFSIKKVLKAGIKYRGASDQYYLDALGHKGSYQEHFLVYARVGKSCRNCGGKIEKMKLAGRGTYFCPTCQR
ncbi:DNA-formamidopyrimidine glycosylase, partial [Patescibacteria group bacterium]|nr:DNA-formamidopyrimidine glycosylase [Patescibacteria group bacterium]